MRPLLFFLFLALAFSCKKENKMCCLPPDPFTMDGGKWIEKSQRLDTLDFNTQAFSSNERVVQFKARPYMDLTVSTVYPRIYSTIYSYYFEQGFIYMRNFLSSSTMFGKYDFTWSADYKSFTIKKFYGRESVPDRLVFEQLK